MRLITATVLLVLVLGCENAPKRPAPAAQPPAEATYFHIAENALNTMYLPPTDPMLPGASRFSYDLHGEFPPTGLIEQIGSHLQDQGWYIAECHLRIIDRKVGCWRLLPNEEGRPGTDQVWTRYWIRRAGDVVEVNINYWKTRTDGGPRFRVELIHFSPDASMGVVDWYGRTHGLPWEQKDVDAPTSGASDSGTSRDRRSPGSSGSSTTRAYPVEWPPGASQTTEFALRRTILGMTQQSIEQEIGVGELGTGGDFSYPMLYDAFLVIMYEDSRAVEAYIEGSASWDHRQP